MVQSRKAGAVLLILILCASSYSHANPVAIPAQRVEWLVEGAIAGIATLEGSPVPIAIGDPFSINLVFELTSMFTQCTSPCAGTGDVSWSGEFTQFTVTMGGTTLVADIGSVYPRYVSFQPGDDATEVDYVSMRLGNQGYEGDVLPVPLTYVGGLLDAAFTFYMADFTGVLFDEQADPWTRDLTIPTPTSSTDTTLFLARQPYNSIFSGALINLDVRSVSPVKAVPEPPVQVLLLIAFLLLGLVRMRARSDHRGRSIEGILPRVFAANLTDHPHNRHSYTN